MIIFECAADCADKSVDSVSELIGQIARAARVSVRNMAITLYYLDPSLGVVIMTRSRSAHRNTWRVYERRGGVDLWMRGLYPYEYKTQIMWKRIVHSLLSV